MFYTLFVAGLQPAEAIVASVCKGFFLRRPTAGPSPAQHTGSALTQPHSRLPHPMDWQPCKFKPFPIISGKVQSFSVISGHLQPFQAISSNFKSCPAMSNNFHKFSDIKAISNYFLPVQAIFSYLKQFPAFVKSFPAIYRHGQLFPADFQPIPTIKAI